MSINSGSIARNSLHIIDLFSGIFKKHTKAEREQLFICGTEKTTPSERSMIAEWPRPWLHSRVFVVLALLSLVSFLITYYFNAFDLPAFFFFSGVTVPFALMLFFWECNVPRNISIFTSVSLFFVGGIILFFLSILIRINIENAYIRCIVEALYQEVLQTAVILFCIAHRKPKLILNGICIGGAISCGFACFLFMVNLYYNNCNDNMVFVVGPGVLESLYQLTLMSAARLFWGVMEGAGLTKVMNGAGFEPKKLLDIRFLWLFCAAFVIHSVFFMPYSNMSILHIMLWVYVIISFAIVLLQLSDGLKQVVQVSNAAWEADAAQMAELEA